MGKTFDGVHRVTFWINPEGNIQRIWTQVKPASHAEEILEALKHQA
jgi:peroxiredoxin Q/BCP